MRFRPLLIGSALLAPIAATSAAHAFPNAFYWHSAPDAAEPGAGGLYGTGGRQDHGVRCSFCHIADPTNVQGRIGVQITATPAFQTIGGQRAYHPGQLYQVSVSLLNEHNILPTNLTAVPPEPGDMNGFGFTIENAAGHLAGFFADDNGHSGANCPQANPYPPGPPPPLGTGVLVPAGKTSLVYGDCHGVVHLANYHLNQWNFTWQAPAAGAGDLSIFVSVIDGNDRGTSSLGDDVVEKTYPLLEGP